MNTLRKRDIWYRLDNLKFAWLFFEDEKFIIRIKKVLIFLIRGTSLFLLEDYHDEYWNTV